MTREQQEKKTKKKRENVVLIILISIFLLLVFLGIYLYFKNKQLPIEIPLPDLIIDTITFSPVTPDTADSIEITLIVRNIGPGFCSASKLSLNIGDEQPLPDQYIPPLIPGDSLDILYKVVMPVAKGYLAMAFADPDSSVLETDETNNGYSHEFFVKTPIKPVTDTKKTVIKIDTVETVPVDTTPPDTVTIGPPDPCEKDTITPWVYPEPSGGRHYGKASIHFIASEPCEIEWKQKDKALWQRYTDQAIILKKSTTICYRAKDTCDNSMETRCEKYEIEVPVESVFCPSDMEYIKIGKLEYCIDRYEWPNKRGQRPMSHISIYHAMDSCFTVTKRLCTTDEWSLACAGAYSWKYPYGDTYEPYACVTRDTAVHVSGDKPECRGYFGIFDMSGNLAEWTNTKAAKNPEFYNVMGGFWDSGPQSSCFRPRYSYYPRNRHNPVGFRCCKEVNKK